MFLEQGVKPGNKFWKYLLGFIAVVAALILGHMIINLVIFLQSLSDNANQLPQRANDSLGYLPPNITLLLLAFGYIIAAGVIYLVVKYLHRQTWQSVISIREKTDRKRIFFAFGGSFIFWLLGQLFMLYIMPDDQVLSFHLVPFLIYFIILFFACFIRAFVEQYVFRGYLMQGVANFTNYRWIPLILIAAINAAISSMHPEQSFYGFTEIFLSILPYTLFLGIITLMDDGIELAIGFHMATLFVIQVIWTSDNTALKTDALFIQKIYDSDTVALEAYLPHLIIIPLFLFIFGKKYKWSGWRKKLIGKIEKP